MRKMWGTRRCAAASAVDARIRILAVMVAAECGCAGSVSRWWSCDRRMVSTVGRLSVEQHIYVHRERAITGKHTVSVFCVCTHNRRQRCSIGIGVSLSLYSLQHSLSLSLYGISRARPRTR